MKKKSKLQKLGAHWFGSTLELNKLKKWQVFILGWCVGAITLLIIMGVMNYILGITFIQK